MLKNEYLRLTIRSYTVLANFLHRNTTKISSARGGLLTLRGMEPILQHLGVLLQPGPPGLETRSSSGTRIASMGPQEPHP